MNAVEIEQAVSNLAEAPFDPAEFPYALLEAFGNKETTLKRLQTDSINQSDLAGEVLQRNNIHIKVCNVGQVSESLKALRGSLATARQKASYILATDGVTLESERLIDGETLASGYNRFPDRFKFFLPLAGISTVRQIDESAFAIRATSRLNRMYVELLKTNRDWDTDERREEMSHFFARLIFCFFAEDTNIFPAPTVSTATVEQFSDRDSSNTHEVISEIFRAMQIKSNEQDRKAAKLPNWANQFPYENGGLISGSLAVPRFSKIAGSYLLHVGNLDWTKINPNIFGSMIQAVADDEERGALGMRGAVGEHFADEVLSGHHVNGQQSNDILPAILVTTRNPNEFRAADSPPPRSTHPMLLISLRNACKTTSDVVPLIDRLFTDIREGEKLSHFQIAEEQKRGKHGAITDTLILRPSISGVGINLKKIFAWFKNVRK